MTFSVVGRAQDGQSFGVAVASKFLAVGAAVPAARCGAGAVATQAYANLAYRPAVLEHLARGATAAQALAAVTGADPLRAQRQAGVIGGTGPGSSWTGPDCQPWAGGVTGEGYAIQGNILTGPEVVERMQAGWLATDAVLSRRLLACLAAGDRAGGDRRGRQSAALLVVTPGGGYGGGSDVLVDLRVDDHPDPVTELARLLDQHDLYFGRPDPATLLPLAGALAEEVGAALRRLGHHHSDLAGALADWAGQENFEERLVAGSIDPPVLDRLRAQAAAAPPPAAPSPAAPSPAAP